MVYFHVAHGPLAPGTALRQYALAQARPEALALVNGLLDGDTLARAALLTETGRLREPHRADPETQLVFIEAVFERVRVRAAPDLPSRFEAVYLWPSLDTARAFRTRFRPHGLVHRCEIEDGIPVLRDPSFVAVGMDLADDVDEQIQVIERRALAYWTTDPPLDAAEILVRGRVIVMHTVGPDA